MSLRRTVLGIIGALSVGSAIAGSFVLGRSSVDPWPLPDPTTTRYLLVIEEDQEGNLTVGDFESDKDGRTVTPDDPRRFLDPIPVDCDEALSELDEMQDAFVTHGDLVGDAFLLVDRYVLIAQHTCKYETYVRYLAEGFADWLYTDQAVPATTETSSKSDDPAVAVDETSNEAVEGTVDAVGEKSAEAGVD